MKTTTNGNKHRRMPVQMVQFAPDGTSVLPVLVDSERAGALLDDYCTAISELDSALIERNAAGVLFDDADRRYRIAYERVQLARLGIRAQLVGGSEA